MAKALGIGQHEVPLDGLSNGQIEILTMVAQEADENRISAERLAEAYESLLQELGEKNRLLKQKEDIIEELQAGDTASHAALRKKQAKLFEDMEQHAEQLTAQVEGKEAELQDALDRVRQLEQENARLRLDVGMLEGERRRDRERPAPAAAARPVRESSHEDLEARMRAERAEEEVRTLQAMLERAVRKEEQALDDLRFFRATTAQEMEEQSKACEAASEKAGDAIRKLQQERAESLRHQTRAQTLSMEVEQLQMEADRAKEDASRLRKELAESRKVEGDLNIQLRRLELLVQQRDSAAQHEGKHRDTPQRIDVHEEGETSEEGGEVLQQVRRLRGVVDSLEEMLNISDPSSRPNGDIVSDTARNLRVQVDRADQLRHHVASLQSLWEYEKDELEKVHLSHREQWNREMLALGDQLAQERSRAEHERSLRQHVEQVQALIYDEDKGRREVEHEESRRCTDIASRFQGTRDYIARRRLTELSRMEGAMRGDVEDLEAAEWAILNAALDEALAAPAPPTPPPPTKRAHFSSTVEEKPRKRQNAYMGLEVSDGVRVKTPRGDTVLSARHQRVKVYMVAPGGPAQEAGIETDDFVTHVNGIPVNSLDDFRSCAKKVRPGDTAVFTVQRRDATLTIRVRTERVDEHAFEPGANRTVKTRISRFNDFFEQRNSRERRRREEMYASSASAAVMAMQQQQNSSRASDTFTAPTPTSARSAEERRARALGVTSASEVLANARKNRAGVNSAATHSLAGANMGPMKHSQFAAARGKILADLFEGDGEEGNGALSASIASQIPARRLASPLEPWKKAPADTRPHIERHNSSPAFSRSPSGSLSSSSRTKSPLPAPETSPSPNSGRRDLTGVLSARYSR